MDTLGGPTPIGANGQVSVPKHVLQALGWSSGDRVVLRVVDEEPDVLRIVPEAVALRQLRRGEEAERMMRMTSHVEPTRDESTSE
ncbi:hypothetical protein A5630_18845 [Mycolicibacterium mucogenicum]|uniref:SpoVT-AbrB domain-containing protein n=2 Tax=Mycolicibacterium mucogenicum TaxID=56689 RepID=A0A1A3H5K9_MYCMU|nr:hypothetical protein A5630_18845 [Mycolicibacterium mucogenicum]